MGHQAAASNSRLESGTFETSYEPTVESAHAVGQDSWLQMGFVLTTAPGSAFILGYPKLILAYLGWVPGVIGLVIGAAASLYASYLLASLHQLDGRRHIRYRDLAKHIYGKKMYFVTWILQYSNLFTINTGFVILAGEAFKATYMAIRDNNEGSMKLPCWIVFVGLLCFAFAFFIPHLSVLRAWLIFSTLLTLVYTIIAVIGCTKADGKRDYSLQGTTTTKVFNIIAAIANIVFAYNSGIIPELQATLKEPAVRNMNKALYLQFCTAAPVFIMIVTLGYWAFGTNVSTYLLNDIGASKTELVVANIAVLLQSVISLHIFASPLYELWDTRLGRIFETPWSPYNTLVRFLARGLYMLVTTFVAACIPFLGDFTNLTGALSTFPLTFVLPNHMYLTANRRSLSIFQRAWHWFNVILFSLLAILTMISAVRLIIVNSTSYNVFADL